MAQNHHNLIKIPNSVRLALLLSFFWAFPSIFPSWNDVYASESSLWQDRSKTFSDSNQDLRSPQNTPQKRREKKEELRNETIPIVSPVPIAQESFNNACRPPQGKVLVPKTREALRNQLGSDFHIVRRGAFLIADNLPPHEHDRLVNGIFPCCIECLTKDYFSTPLEDIVTIYVFRNTQSYREGLRRYFKMMPISPYGHYGHSQRYIVINYDTGPGTLVHELTHALMATDFPQAPIWISEGLASLYEQCRVEGTSLRGEPNWRLPELQAALALEKLTPLRQLLAFSTLEFRSKNESLYYSQSRYFCKYLEEQGVLRQVYAEFRREWRSDRTGIQVIERILGRPIELIEQEWKAWIQEERWE